jgi:hypothetical protein
MVPDDFLKIYPTPMALCREIGYVNLILALQQDEGVNEWDLRYNKKIYYKSKIPGTQLRDYILNTIASEIYNVEN